MHIFISYARSDGAFVRTLHNHIVNKGREAWTDWQNIRAFDPNWRVTLFSAIEACNTFAFIMSPASVESGVCAEEVAHAVQHGKRLAVIVLKPVPDHVWKERLPWLDTPQWFMFKEHNGSEELTDQLLFALD